MARTMADLGNRVWDDNEMQAFSIGENTRKYQDYKKQLEDDYDKNYSMGGNFLNWLGNGLSGGGWSKGDFLKNRGITDETDAYGNAGYFGNSSMGDLRNAGSEYNKGRLAQLEAGKGLFSGVPIIGDLLSAPTQVVSAGKDLAEGGLSKWQNGKRDWLSDLGALGETGLDIATLGTAKGATAGAKTLGKTIAKGAGLGAAYGLTGGLNEMGAKDFDLGRLALNTGIGAGVGGGISGLSYGLGKAWNKYAPSTKTETITTMGDATPYQEALNSLKNNATGARYSDVATNLPTTQGPDLARITLNNLDDDTLKTLYRSASRNTHPDKVGEAVGDSLFKSVNESNNLLQDFLKNGIPTSTTTNTIPLTRLERLKSLGSNIPNMGKDLANTKVGTNIANLLKTKRGKVLLGGSAGLTLAGLMKNRNDNTGQLSDEEMQELYNYIYGGQ